jgi:hypothetical protein
MQVDEHTAERGLQVQLYPVTILSFGQGTQQLQPSAQMSGRFLQSGARDREASGFKPERHGPLREPAFGPMSRKKLRPRRSGFRM